MRNLLYSLPAPVTEALAASAIAALAAIGTGALAHTATTAAEQLAVVTACRRDAALSQLSDAHCASRRAPSSFAR